MQGKPYILSGYILKSIVLCVFPWIITEFIFISRWFKHLRNLIKVKNFKKDFFGSVPSPFIGRYDYPNVNIGVLGLQILLFTFE